MYSQYRCCPVCFGYSPNGIRASNYPLFSHPHYSIHPQTDHTMCNCLFPTNPVQRWIPAYGAPVLPQCQRSKQKRVIIRFNLPPLLEKYPDIKGERLREAKNHPYRKWLQDRYSNILNQIRRMAPDLKVHHTFDTLVSGVAVTLPEEVITKLEKLPVIKSIVLDGETSPEYKAQCSIETSQGINENNLRLIGARDVRRMNDHEGRPVDGSGVRVAVIDAGFNMEQLPSEKIVDQHNFTSDEFKGEHGTMVTRVILDVSPGVSILAYKAFMDSEVIKAVERALLHGANIINYSRGRDVPYAVGENVFEQAVMAGVVVVKSVGNGGSNTGAGSPSSPHFIGVGATTVNGKKVAPYSNYGVNPPLYEIKPDMVAPGAYVFHGVTREGTSIAAPYVAGSAALMKQVHSAWNPQQIKSGLAITATKIEEREESSVFSDGSGLINVAEAIQVPTLIYPIHLSIKVSGSYVSLWIENRSQGERTYRLSWFGRYSIFTEIPLRRFSVLPGETKEVRLYVSRDVGPAAFGMIRIDEKYRDNSREYHIPVITSPYLSIVNPLINVGSVVNAVSYSPDGSNIASGSNNGKIQIWDAEKGSIISFINVGAMVLSVAYSPDGKRIVSGSANSKIQVWDAKTGNELFSVDLGYWIHSVSYSPDGKHIVSASDNKKVQVWDAVSGNSVLSIDVGSFVTSAVYSPDGKHIASSADRVQIWEAETGAIVTQNVKETVNAVVSYSPDGEYFVFGIYDVKVFNMKDAAVTHSLSTGGAINSVGFSPDGSRFMIGLNNGKIQGWAVDRFESFFEIDVGRSVKLVTYSPDGDRILAVVGEEIRVYRPAFD